MLTLMFKSNINRPTPRLISKPTIAET